MIQTEKLASLGQLTAGIAHEIKNPLNFVNNFAALSIELIDELKDAIGSAPPDEEQAAELMELLAGNLDKVVQHGKRANSIVKNMLLHSRAGSGERRVADINALVEESLNLAYHGARAEKQGFNVTIERSLDPSAGEVDVLPQEITRVLLNLISNGFYATVKRKERGDALPTSRPFSRRRRNLGDRVEIRIRDNGTGVPPEVKEKMFNPFFTTKPAGEGTGLGLSLSHDIIVKQHAGSIEVDTQPGEFTEFRIVLPRTGSPAKRRCAGERPYPGRRRRGGCRAAVSAAVPAGPQSRAVRDGVRTIGQSRRCSASATSEAPPDPDLVRHQHAGDERPRAVAEGEGCAPGCACHHDHRLWRRRSDCSHARGRTRVTRRAAIARPPMYTVNTAAVATFNVQS